MLKCETVLVSLLVIDVDHDCLCVDDCQTSDCQTVRLLDWVNSACVPVSGKIVFTLSALSLFCRWFKKLTPRHYLSVVTNVSLYGAPGSQQQFISAVYF